MNRATSFSIDFAEVSSWPCQMVISTGPLARSCPPPPQLAAVRARATTASVVRGLIGRSRGCGE
ncbi:hypothetical protein [Nonomuraea sp. NPDC052265]|uniref:hypothetical protein n=1 Tax=Nonomuraea sp. NPDC052265 TaxID=3364374 RepID=UPI0037C53194